MKYAAVLASRKEVRVQFQRHFNVRERYDHLKATWAQEGLSFFPAGWRRIGPRNGIRAYRLCSSSLWSVLLAELSEQAGLKPKAEQTWKSEIRLGVSFAKKPEEATFSHHFTLKSLQFINRNTILTKVNGEQEKYHFSGSKRSGLSGF